MAPRQRKDSNRDLPEGMRKREGYYSWRHPETGEEFGLGRDRSKAITEVREALAHVYSKRPTLLDRMQSSVKTWGEWCDEFQKILDRRKSAANTIKTRKTLIKHIRAIVPLETAAARAETKDCARVLNKLIDEGKSRTAQAVRGMMIDCFDRLIAQGVRKDNPASVTDSVLVSVNRARLDFDVFMRVHKATEIVELRNAMSLALVSSQPRECICAAMFKDQVAGQWENHRGKTDVRIRIPHELRLDCFGMSLGDVVAECRKTGVVSPYLIHRRFHVGKSRPGQPLHRDQLTRAFTAELAKLGIDWGDKEPPTFHEIRSLSERLYSAQGNVKTQDLLGHKQAKTTDTYHDPRGEWVQVVVKK